MKTKLEYLPVCFMVTNPTQFQKFNSIRRRPDELENQENPDPINSNQNQTRKWTKTIITPHTNKSHLVWE